MSSDSRDGTGEPAWELLPDRPIEFFQLEPGFDRKTLKRAYGKLIRRFKPERFPEEFQRIRAAYESVDDMLRHGALSGGREAEDSWVSEARELEANTTPHQPGSESEGDDPRPGSAGLEPMDRTEPSVDPRESPRQRVARLGPDFVYAEIQDKAHSPKDYYLLALLSDMVSDHGGCDFFEWVCRGLAAHPGDAHLIRLCYSWCHRLEVDLKSGQLLVRLARLMTTAEFGYVTEHLWVQLSKRIDFDTLRELLDACWSRTLDRGYASRFALTLRLTRRCMFRADLDWLRDQMSFLWENGVQDGYGEEEFYLLDVLFDYRMVREAFLEEHPGRESVDRVLRGICELDESDADRMFLEWRTEHRMRGEELLEALPAGDESVYPACRAIATVTAEVEDRLGEVREALGVQKHRLTVQRFVERLDQRTERSLLGWVSSLWSCSSFLLFPFVSLTAISWLMEKSGTQGWPWFLGFLTGMLTVAAGWWDLLLPRLYYPLRERLLARQYRKSWRGAVMEFLGQEPISREELLGELRTAVSLKDEALPSSLADHLDGDGGLAIYSLVLHAR